MILPKDVFSEAYGALRQNRRRTAITMLGMGWGIATVVLLLAYGTGFSTAIVSIFKAYASMQSMGIAGGRTSMQAGGNKAGVNVRLTNDDIDRLLTNVPQIIRISPESLYEARSATKGALTPGRSVAAIQFCKRSKTSNWIPGISTLTKTYSSVHASV